MQFLLAFFFVALSARPIIAGTCSIIDLESCTDQEICERAIGSISGIDWRDRANKFVIEAERRNLNCIDFTDIYSMSISSPEGVSISVQVPKQCLIINDKIVTNSKNVSCEYKKNDTSITLVNLHLSTLPINDVLDFYGIKERVFAQEPANSLLFILKNVEQVEREKILAAGLKLEISQLESNSFYAKSHGLNACLFSNLDYVLVGSDSPERIDSITSNCLWLVQKSDTVASIRIKLLNFHKDRLKHRGLGFEAEAEKIINSLKIEEKWVFPTSP